MSGSQQSLQNREETYNRRDRDNQCGRNDDWQSRTRRATDQPDPWTQ